MTIVFAEPQHWPTVGKPVPTFFPIPKIYQGTSKSVWLSTDPILSKNYFVQNLIENTLISNIYLAKGWSLGIANFIYSITRQPHSCNSRAAFNAMTQRIKFLY